MCVQEREREKERKRERETESVHARVRVWEREGFAIVMVGLILSGIRFKRYCIELVFWKRTNSSLVIRTLILTRQTCGQRSSMAAGSKHQALALASYVSERI